MLFSTLIQPSAFFSLSIFGLCAGFVFSILINLIKMFVKNKFFCHFFNFFVYFFVFLCFFYSNLIFNFGEFRLFSIVAFALSFFISLFFATKFLGSFFSRCYNKVKVKFDEKTRRTKKI